MDNVIAPTNSPVVTPLEVTSVPNNSLLTEIPEEGRQLAVKMSRLIIKLTQPDEKNATNCEMFIAMMP
jgi:hypothetical protein